MNPPPRTMIRTAPPSDTDIPGHPLQRVLDVSVALPLAVISLPIVVLAGMAVKATSRGPMLYTQQRAGRSGRLFHICKIRTMRHNCEAESGACWSVAGDPRVTRVGRWLRKLHLDELPQLWNVLAGDMSMVGPRPERPEILNDLAASIPNVHERMQVRPGVTGLAQIQQPPDVTPDCFRRKLLYDRHYIRHRGLAVDVRILLGTALYLTGVSYAKVRRLAGLSVPMMPDDTLTYRVPVSPSREAAPLLESTPGVSG